MDCSSEDSFAWTDTSSDSIDSQNMGFNKEIEEKVVSGIKSERKRQLKQLLNHVDNSHEEENDTKLNLEIEQEQSSDERYKFKQSSVKIEPESENEVPKKKKKKKHLKTEKNKMDEQESTFYDESYLNLKVKQENMFSPPHESKVKKKHKLVSVDCNHSTSDTFDDNNHSSLEENGSTPFESDIGKTRKKKKKTKRENHKEHQDSAEINDKLDFNELTSDMSHINNKSDVKLDMKCIAESLLTESYSLQDETNYSEISDIQGSDDHSLHSLTPNDCKSATTKQKNASLCKRTVLNQFQIDQASQNIEKRMYRISDRIMFEDDEETDSHTNIHNQLSSKLKKCLKGNSDFQKVSQEIPQNVKLSDDDEIWLVKCPRHIDVEALLGTEFNTDTKCKIKVSGETYDISLEGEQPYLITLLHMTQKNVEMKNVPLVGTINYHKRMPKAHFHHDNVMMNNQTSFIPLPEIKCRHPLFASNYKKIIKTPAYIAEKFNLENSDDRSLNVQKLKKKKHKKSRTAPDEVDEASIVTKCEPDVSLETVGKKRKKLKDADDESPAPKKAKRIKHESECAEPWDSEKAIEKTLFNF